MGLKFGRVCQKDLRQEIHLEAFALLNEPDGERLSLQRDVEYERLVDSAFTRQGYVGIFPFQIPFNVS